MLGRLYVLLIFVLTVGITQVHAQELDDIFNSIEKEEELPLLPDKMLFTQRFLWGENGLLRRSELAPLSPIQRSREIELRRKMLVTHQVLGYVTLASMIAQGIIGGKLYNCDNCDAPKNSFRAAEMGLELIRSCGIKGSCSA